MGKLETAMREEITRLAKKEIRGAVGPLRKELIRLKKRVVELTAKQNASEKQTGLLVKERKRKRLGEDVTDDQANASRMSGGLIKKLRTKLGISRAKFATLVGVSGQTVKAWENGNYEPAGDNLKAVIALRAYGKREAQVLLENMEG